MEAIWTEIIEAILPWIKPTVAAAFGLLITWLLKRAALIKAAKDAAVEAEKAIGPGQGPQKKRKANDLLKQTWHGKMTTQMNMEAVIQEHGMKEITRRASMVPKPNAEADETK